MARRVLVADDTEDIRVLLEIVLGAGSYDVVGPAEDGREAIALWNQARADGLHALVLDHRMPHMTGLEVARQVLAEDPSQRIILFSAQVDDELREEALAAGVAAVIQKEELIGITSHPALAA